MDEAALNILGEGARNAEKDTVEGALESSKIIWGLLYDLGSFTVQLPEAKVEKATHLLGLPCFDTGSARVPLKIAQEPRGCQKFLTTVKPQLRPLLGATDVFLGPPGGDGHAQPKGTEGEQHQARAAFHEAVELQRVLVGDPTMWSGRFASSLQDVLSTQEMLVLPGVTERVVWVTGDATPERIGAVDWTSRTMVVERVGDFIAPVHQFLVQAGQQGVQGALVSLDPGPEPVGSGTPRGQEAEEMGTWRVRRRAKRRSASMAKQVQAMMEGG